MDNKLLIERIITLLDYMTKEKYFDGNIGACIMNAISELIKICSILKLPLKERNKEIIPLWLKFLDQALTHFDEEVVESAVACLPELLRAYLRNPDQSLDRELLDRTLGYIRKSLKSESNQVDRIGYFNAIGITANVLKSFDSTINLLPDIITACQITQQTLNWDQSRKAGINGLTDFLIVNDVNLSDDEIIDAFKVYPQMLSDYTKDARGDIGRIIREAGTSNFERVVVHFLEKQRLTVFTKENISTTFQMLAQISLETIDQTREISCKTFLRLLHKTEPCHLAVIPSRDKLLELFPDRTLESRLFSGTSVKSFRYFTRLIDVEDYRESSLVGISSTIGGLGVDASNEASKCFLKLIASHEEANANNDGYYIDLMKSICCVFEKNLRNTRITKPMFKLLQMALTDARFIKAFSDNTETLSEIFELIKKETLNSNQIPMLRGSIELLTSLMTFTQDDFWKKPGARLMVLLGHRFPVIRRTTASYLYETLLIEEFDLSQESIGKLNEALCDTVWEDDLVEVRKTRDGICDLLGLDRPKGIPINK